jgi:hypothetical protein
MEAHLSGKVRSPSWVAVAKGPPDEKKDHDEVHENGLRRMGERRVRSRVKCRQFPRELRQRQAPLE